MSPDARCRPEVDVRIRAPMDSPGIPQTPRWRLVAALVVPVLLLGDQMRLWSQAVGLGIDGFRLSGFRPREGQ